nr:MAG TPA: hypothetical protein [Bacteriophage sp.]
MPFWHKVGAKMSRLTVNLVPFWHNPCARVA